MTPQDTTTKRRVSRRHVLTALSGATIGLSGCLGGLLGSSSSTITNTSVKPFKLVVTLREGASVSKVNLISPNGTAVNSKRIPGGQTSVSLLLVSTADVGYTPLSPGTYTIAVVNNGETVAEQDVQLKASWELTNIQMKEKVDVVATFKNTGKLPIRVTYLGLTDGVPHPVKPPQKGETATPTRTNAPERSRFQQFIGNGKRATFSTAGRPLAFYEDPSDTGPRWYNKAIKCRGLTHNATLTVRMAPTGSQTYSVPITYTGKPVREIAIRKCSKITIGNTSRKSNG